MVSVDPGAAGPVAPSTVTASKVTRVYVYQVPQSSVPVRYVYPSWTLMLRAYPVWVTP